MTIVLGRRFGERIILASDTRISDEDAARQNVIPGRLKAVVLGPFFSVAYAGHSDPAQMALRACRKRLLESGPDDAVELLRRESARSDVQVDFLVAIHHPATLLKVSKGRVSAPGDGFAIGDLRVDRAVNERAEDEERRIRQYSSGPILVEFLTTETLFTSAFCHVAALDADAHGFDGVGGLPVCLLASPYGHTYQDYAVSIGVKDFLLGPETPELVRQRNSGELEFKFNVVAPRLRGVGVVAAVMPQGRLGWTYDPINREEAEVVQFATAIDAEGGYGPMLEEMVALVESAANAFGGGVAVD